MESVARYKAALAPLDTPLEEVDLASLVEAYSPLLFRVAHSILRNREEAEDAVQDTFVRVVQHRRQLSEIRDRRVWLVRIIWNLALDRRRRVRPEQLDQDFAANLAAHCAPADQILNEAERVKAVLDAIEKLAAAERQALLLSAVDELTSAEIASVMDRSEAAVRGLLFRARNHLHRRLERRR